MYVEDKSVIGPSLKLL